MSAQADDGVAPAEVALLVDQYLLRGFPRASAAFQLEAAALLQDVQPPGGDVKCLEEILSDYVALESKARARAKFEGTFGEDIAVRTCLAKLGQVLDDFMALRRRSETTTSPLAAACLLGADGQDSSRGGSQHVAEAMPPLAPARSRKSRRPNRRDQSTVSSIVVNSRRLFGRGACGLEGGGGSVDTVGVASLLARTSHAINSRGGGTSKWTMSQQ